jgi:hypothetical protein
VKRFAVVCDVNQCFKLYVSKKSKVGGGGDNPEVAYEARKTLQQ